MRIYHSLFPDNFVRQFPGWETADEHITLYDYRANYVGVEQMLSACHTLWPPIIDDEGGVFVRRSYLPQVMQELRTKFGGDIRHVERWLNAQELVDFFVGDRIADRPALYRPELLLAFGEALKLFWGLRLKSLFPEREFVFAIGDDLEGASGLAITLYQRERISA